MAKRQSTKALVTIIDDVESPSGELVVPTRAELEKIPPAERWVAEEKLDEVADTLREINNAELRHWVEVEGKTQAEIAELVGRPRSTIARRASELGLQSHSPRGRKRIVQANNSEPTPCPTCRRMVPEIKGVWEDDAPLPADAKECPTCGWPVEPPPKPIGVRKRKRQRDLIGSVTTRLDGIGRAVGEVDWDAIDQSLAGERRARTWLMELEEARSQVSQLINGLREFKTYQKIKATEIQDADFVFIHGDLHYVRDVLAEPPDGEPKTGLVWLSTHLSEAVSIPKRETVTVERLGGDDNA